VIHSLRLENWGPFASVTLDFERPLALFVGPNGAGKSWIRDALVFAITGTLRTRPGITKKNQIPETALRDGAKAAEVEVLFAGGLRVVRKVTTSGSQALDLSEPNGTGDRKIPGTNEELQADLYKRLGLDEGRAIAALDARQFLALDSDERKALLFRALGAGVTVEAVVKALAARGFDDQVARDVAAIAATRGFRKAEDHAVELRREAKRKLDGLVVPQVERYIDGRSKRMDLEEADEAAIARGIRALEEERDKILADKGATRATARASADGMKRRKAEIEQVLGAGVEDAQTLQEQLDLEKDLSNGLVAELQAAEKELAEACAIGAVAGRIENPGTCPAIPGGFQCPATAAKLAAHAKAVREIADGAAAKRKAIEPRVAALRRDAGTAQANVEDLRQRLQAAKDAERQIESLQRELAELEERIPQAEQVARELEGAGRENPGATKADELRQRIARGQEVLSAKRAYEAAKKKAEEVGAQRQALADAHAKADELAHALAPDGVEQDLLREAIGPVRARLEETGKALGRVTLGDDLMLRVEVGGVPRSEAQLSGGQTLLLGIIVQDALTMVTRLPALVVDGADLLVQELRRNALGMLERLIDRPYGSIWVLAATAEQNPTRPPSPKVEMFWVSGGGRVEVV
jgi:DNA repair exonuclease SbcCD ATPase subunit